MLIDSIMKKIILAITIIFASFVLDAQEIDSENKIIIQISRIVQAAKTGDKMALAKRIKYPLKRPYPIPDIHNANEMVQRMDQIFDRHLLEEISISSEKDDWSPVGWRGTMLNNGTLWIDMDGKIYTINYHSDFEILLKQHLIEKERNRLHPSLKKYESPVLIAETSRFRIRIDLIADGLFRYASWPLARNQNSKPSLVILSGTLKIEGTIRNHFYNFKNGNYLYSISTYPLKNQGGLMVLKNKKIILEQKIERFGKPFKFFIENSKKQFHNFR